MKGFILSGSFGARLRHLTYSQQKQLIPVANKPILFYAIEDLIEDGFNYIGEDNEWTNIEITNIILNDLNKSDSLIAYVKVGET